MSKSDEAARHGCLWVARPDLGTLVVTGSDRASWLQGILSADVEHLSAGQGVWALVLTKQGKILADAAVVAGGERIHLGLVRGAVERVADWLSQFLVMEDAVVEDASSAFAWGMLHGPRSAVVAHNALPEAGADAAVASIDFTGLGGAALVVPAQRFDDIERTMSRRGDVVVGSLADWNRLRIERVLPLHGIDIDEQRSPHEASLDRRAVSWTKGCYLGQEAVCMQDMRGKVKRRLVAVRIDSDRVPGPGTPVTLPNGSKVGETRSASWSDLWGSPLALALLSADATAPGTELRVESSVATVVEPR